MKHILVFIFLPFMFLLCARYMNEALYENERVGTDNVLQEDIARSNGLFSVAELPEWGEPCVDFKSWAHQFRICGRSQCSLSVLQIFLNDVSASRLPPKRLEVLFHTVHRIYTSLPHQSWSVASRHYVFELRRILI